MQIPLVSNRGYDMRVTLTHTHTHTPANATSFADVYIVYFHHACMHTYIIHPYIQQSQHTMLMYQHLANLIQYVCISFEINFTLSNFPSTFLSNLKSHTCTLHVYMLTHTHTHTEKHCRSQGASKRQCF